MTTTTMMSAAATDTLLPRVRQAYTAHQASEFRACELCDHRRAGGHCARHGAAVRVARSSHGACGPDARHMRVEAWGLS